MKNITDDQLKTCNDCGKKKPLNEYTERKNHRGTGAIYLSPYCKTCMVKRTKKWVKVNRDEYNAYQRVYNKEKRYAKKEKGEGGV